MDLINNNFCGWTRQLTERSNFKLLDQDIYCDYLIVGAGYTGLSAARKLSDIMKDKKIILIDAQLAGEGGSSRNIRLIVIGMNVENILLPLKSKMRQKLNRSANY